ncbi:hypothetical protein MUY35_02145 [Aliiroseovarius sp. S1339]|uniref:hypothetical protein n=1 Tax=Aliiroseovarius sp. S1339 TaxID=2936990 RepID=UPI0020C1162E|nr:hypothetical protein [Aliiroseovarius sp. S1339]MCK8462647.1 hypothetical protein [Aliiroseovarius sp. S1339]
MISTKNGDTKTITCAEQLDQAARMVQDVAYALANRVDNTTLTELMLTSRKLERLSERVNAANLGSVKINRDDDR